MERRLLIKNAGAWRGLRLTSGPHDPPTEQTINNIADKFENEFMLDIPRTNPTKIADNLEAVQNNRDNRNFLNVVFNNWTLHLYETGGLILRNEETPLHPCEVMWNAVSETLAQMCEYIMNNSTDLMHYSQCRGTHFTVLKLWLQLVGYTNNNKTFWPRNTAAYRNNIQ